MNLTIFCIIPGKVWLYILLYRFWTHAHQSVCVQSMAHIYNVWYYLLCLNIKDTEGDVLSHKQQIEDLRDVAKKYKEELESGQ